MKKKGRSLRRRDFLKAAATTSAGLLIVHSRSVRGAPANSSVRVGLIGCGSRGRFVSRFFPEHTGAQIVSIADPFKDRVDALKNELDKLQGTGVLDEKRCYVGLDAYKAVIESNVEAVLIESPPYFHPVQAAAAIAAGKHVYMAKPVAVDAPGCTSILESARKAQARNLSFLVDFQTSANEFYIEAVKRVHEGAIGTPVSGQVYYIAGRLAKKPAQPGESDDAARLRNWVFDKVLSGDIIVEQNIHVLDVANWLLQSHPVKALGTGGRKARVDVGDCWDHFLVTFWYPNDVLMDFSSAQYTLGYSDLCCRIYGTKGTVDTHYGGGWPVRITGDNPWPGGETKNIYQEGAIKNVRDFVDGIAAGKPVNTGERGAISTLTSVLGRMAAYRGRTVTWDEMMKENETLETTLKL